EYLRHVAGEVERAAPREGEEDELDAEAHRLTHAEELSRLAGELHRELYDAEDAIGARLRNVRRALDHLTRIDPALGEWRELVDNAYFGLEEMGRRMGEYRSSLEHDPARLEEVRQRQHLLFRLRSKYGGDLGAVLAVGRGAREELDALDRADLDRKALVADRDAARAAHAELCLRLSAHRRAAVERLDREITDILPGLGMPGGQFTAELMPCEPGPGGAETVEFRVALNEGFEARPLARVASGGELSRVMLALKTVLARVDRLPTLVFDEIDAGIGGRVAHRVAEKLRSVADHHQVFVVTHLAQIASRADHHLLVEKSPANGSAATVLHELEGAARVRELARLLGGDPESEASIEHAREMLAAS
ncbi:MAG: DNA repair protein RecN, partial [Longimicrobiales bacterium]